MNYYTAEQVTKVREYEMRSLGMIMDSLFGEREPADEKYEGLRSEDDIYDKKSDE